MQNYSPHREPMSAAMCGAAIGGAILLYTAEVALTRARADFVTAARKVLREERAFRFHDPATRQAVRKIAMNLHGGALDDARQVIRAHSRDPDAELELLWANAASA